MRNGNRQQKKGWEKGNLFFGVHSSSLSLSFPKKGAVEEEEKTKCERGEV